MADNKTASAAEETTEQAVDTATDDGATSKETPSTEKDRHSGITITSGKGIAPETSEKPAKEKDNTPADPKSGDDEKTDDPDAASTEKETLPKKDAPEEFDDKDGLIRKDDPTGVQKRINRAVKLQRESERKELATQKEKEALEARIAAFEANGDAGTDTKPGAKEKTPQDTSESEPKEDDFDDYTAYIRALNKWDNKQSMKPETDIDAKVNASVEERLAKDRADKDAQAATESQQAFIADGAEKYPDFKEVALDPEVPYTPVMIEAMVESERAVDIAYYLGQNHDEADRISRLSPIQTAKEIGHIEANLEAEAPREGAKDDGTTEGKPGKKTTSAPEPIKPVKGSTTVKKNPKDMTQSEYEAWRKSGGGE